MAPVARSSPRLRGAGARIRASIRADFVLRSSREFYPASLRWPTNVALEIGAPSGPASR